MKKWAVILSVLLVLVVAGFLIVPKYIVQQTTLQTPVCSGGQVLSLDSARIVDSPELGKKVIRAVFSTNPTAECLDINLNPSQIELELKETEGRTDFDAVKSVIGDINLIDSKKAYNIIQSRETGGAIKKIRKLTLQPISLDTLSFDFCTINECKSRGTAYSKTIYALKSSFIGGCNCIFDDEIGIAGEISSSEQYQWKTQISIGGQTAELTNTQLSAKIGTIAFIKWSGNLASNDNLGSINRDTYEPYTSNAWRVVAKGNADYLTAQYEETKRNILSECYNTISPLFPSLQTTNFICSNGINKASAYNALVDSRTTDGLSAWASSEPLVRSASISNNLLSVNLKSPIVYPTFTLDIDASEIGVFISKGKPSVQCPSTSISFNSGEQKQAVFNVKNIGLGSGSFTYDLNCDKGYQILQPSPPRNIAAASSLAVTGTLSMTVAEGTETADCKFTATELNTLEQASCSYSYSAKHIIECIEGTKSCNQGNSELWTCRADGSYEQVKCTNGCEAFESSYRCRLTASPPPKTEPLCKPFWQLPESFLGFVIIPNLSSECLGLLGSAKLIGAIILAILGSFLLFKYIRKESLLQSSKKKPYNGIIQLVILAVVFLALFAFAFKVFWYGLIFLVIILIITFLIKRASGGLL